MSDLKPTTSGGSFRWTICALLFVATTINYMDRQIIGLLKADLFSPSQGLVINQNQLDALRLALAHTPSFTAEQQAVLAPLATGSVVALSLTTEQTALLSEATASPEKLGIDPTQADLLKTALAKPTRFLYFSTAMQAALQGVIAACEKADPARFAVLAKLKDLSARLYLDPAQREIVKSLDQRTPESLGLTEEQFKTLRSVRNNPHDGIELNEREYSRLVMAFQFAYALGLPLFGWLIDRFGTKLSFSGAMVFWSLAATAHAWCTSVISFAVARFALGIGEAGNFPAANKATAEWFPKRERALAISLFNSGTNVGAMCAPLLVPWLAVMYGWQGALIAVGAVGFVWLLAWLPLYHHPAQSPYLGDAEKKWITQDEAGLENVQPVTWRTLLRYRQTWAFAIGKFCTDPIWWFYLFWLPGWLMKEFKINLKDAGLPLFTIYLMATVGSILIAQLSSRMIANGISANRARKTAMLVCGLMVIPIVFATQAGNLWMAVSLVGLAAAAHQGFSANIFATVSDMFPKRAVASVTGLGGMFGSIGSLLFAETTGRVLDAAPDAYWVLFAIGASAYLIALLFVHLMSPRMEPVKLD